MLGSLLRCLTVLTLCPPAFIYIFIFILSVNSFYGRYQSYFFSLVLVLVLASSGPEIAGTGAVTPDNYSHKSQRYIYYVYIVYSICI